MPILSTGPIENSPSGGTRQTQNLTVRYVNNSAVNASTVLVQGYYLNETRTLYVLESFTLSPNQSVTRTYSANFNGFQFIFTTNGPAEDETEISVWGKNASGQITASHRLVSSELLGAEGLMALAYGSLFGSISSLPVIVGSRLNFEEAGPALGVAADTVNNEIVVGSKGVYLISFSLNITNEGSGFSTFSVYVNNTEVTFSRISYGNLLSDDTEVGNSANTIQLSLNEGDAISVQVVQSAEEAFYIYPSLTVTRIA
ncbi:hypothetical protein ACQ0QQ_13590 [Lysinibacillus sphaericus]